MYFENKITVSRTSDNTFIIVFDYKAKKNKGDKNNVYPYTKTYTATAENENDLISRLKKILPKLKADNEEMEAFNTAFDEGD